MRAAVVVVVLAALSASVQTPAELAQTGGAVQGGQILFRVAVEEEERVAMAAVVEEGGVPYVSLIDLMGKLGGGCRILPGRVQVDFARHTAWMQVNETQVDASLRRFTMLHPILRRGDAALMAVSDVGPFFAKAFRVAVKHVPVRSTPASTGTSRVQIRALPEPDSESIVLPREQDVRRPVPAEPPHQQRTAVPVQAGRPIRVVIIDPGHGGNDSGCEGRLGLKEKDLALAVALRLRKQLEGAGGLAARLTRSEDVELTQRERAEFANGQSGDLLISIHAGASFAPGAHGFEIFYCPAPGALNAVEGRSPWKQPPMDYARQSRALAEAVAAALLDATAAANRGIHEVQCRLLEDVFMPALLIEVGCLTNAAEEALLETEAYQIRIAQGIAAGLLRFAEAQENAGAAP